MISLGTVQSNFVITFPRVGLVKFHFRAVPLALVDDDLDGNDNYSKIDA